MFKYYIITWVVMSWHQVPCPKDPPVIDKFGRVSESMIESSVLCGESDSVFHKVRIDKMDSAYRFYREALAALDTSEYPDIIGNGQSAITHVKIDSFTKR